MAKNELPSESTLLICTLSLAEARVAVRAAAEVIKATVAVVVNKEEAERQGHENKLVRPGSNLPPAADYHSTTTQRGPTTIPHFNKRSSWTI